MSRIDYERLKNEVTESHTWILIRSMMKSSTSRSQTICTLWFCYFWMTVCQYYWSWEYDEYFQSLSAQLIWRSVIWSSWTWSLGYLGCLFVLRNTESIYIFIYIDSTSSTCSVKNIILNNEKDEKWFPSWLMHVNAYVRVKGKKKRRFSEEISSKYVKRHDYIIVSSRAPSLKTIQRQRTFDELMQSIPSFHFISDILISVILSLTFCFVFVFWLCDRSSGRDSPNFSIQYWS